MIQEMSSYWKLSSLLVSYPLLDSVLMLICYSKFMRAAFTTFINATRQWSLMNLNTRIFLLSLTLELMQILLKRLFLSLLGS